MFATSHDLADVTARASRSPIRVAELPRHQWAAAIWTAQFSKGPEAAAGRTL